MPWPAWPWRPGSSRQHQLAPGQIKPQVDDFDCVETLGNPAIGSLAEIVVVSAQLAAGDDPIVADQRKAER